MKNLNCILYAIFFLAACSEDNGPIIPTAEEAIAGQWNLDTGVFIWDNGLRMSSVDKAFEDIPTVTLIFDDQGNYLGKYSFLVKREDEDPITITNGLQEGIFQLTMEQQLKEAGIYQHTGQILFTNTVTDTDNISSARYSYGQSTDTMWIKGLILHNLLFGEIDGVFIKTQ